MKSTAQRPADINTVEFQRKHWEEELAEHDWDSSEIFGNAWGNPDDKEDRWGNYPSIKKRIQSFAIAENTLLEIGSLAGKWTQFCLDAKKIVCVDINDLGFKYIAQKFPNEKIEFYLSQGDELKGIPDSSVDVVFSMDTLVRVPKECIEKYFSEASRVLRPGGRIFIHLAVEEKEVCVRKEFTCLRIKEIKDLCESNNFGKVEIDQDTIIHGVIVEGEKR